jgi:hypothetical protein
MQSLQTSLVTAKPCLLDNTARCDLKFSSRYTICVKQGIVAVRIRQGPSRQLPT